MGKRIGTGPLVAPEVPGHLARARSEIAQRGSEAGSLQSPAATFDARNEIIRNPDGTVSSKKSQQLGNLRQLRDDASALADNARELIDVGPEAALRKAEEARARQETSELSRAIQSTPEIPRMTPNSGKRK